MQADKLLQQATLQRVYSQEHTVLVFPANSILASLPQPSWLDGGMKYEVQAYSRPLAKGLSQEHTVPFLPSSQPSWLDGGMQVNQVLITISTL